MKKILLSFLLISIFGFIIFGQSSALEIPIRATSVEPDTLEDGTVVMIGESTDDVEEENDLTKSWIEAVDDDDLDVGWEGAPTKMNILSLGMRFTDITIPQGATIDSAFLTVFCHESKKDPNDICIIDVYGEATDNAVTFNDSDLVTDRPRTSATLKWTIDEPWFIWEPYSSPDLGEIIQEIVNRPGWTWKSSIALILVGDNYGPSDYENAREFMSFENKKDQGDKDEEGNFGDGNNHPECVPKLTIYSASVSVPGVYAQKSFNVYPNPAKGMLNVSFESSGAARIQIFNVTGQMVRSAEITSQKFTMDIHDLKSGVYMFRALQGNSIHTQKVILK